MKSLPSVNVVYVHPNRTVSDAVRVAFDFDDGDHTWTFSFLATRYEQRLGLLCRHRSEDESACKVVSQIRESRRVHSILAHIRDLDGDKPKSLADQLVDMLLTLAPGGPSVEAVAYIKWRVCEWISSQRRRDVESSQVA